MYIFDLPGESFGDARYGLSDAAVDVRVHGAEGGFPGGLLLLRGGFRGGLLRGDRGVGVDHGCCW